MQMEFDLQPYAIKILKMRCRDESEV